MKHTFAALFLMMLFWSCKETAADRAEDLREAIPEVQDISKFPQSEFVATLESPLAAGKNSIYAASLLMAWNEFRNTYKGELALTSGNTEEFRLVNASTSFRNVLAPEEYEAEWTVNEDGSAEVFANFSVVLPFKYDMQDVKRGINFAGTNAKAFGIMWHDAELTYQVNVLYYEDDDHFVMELKPRDRAHSVVMAVGIDMNGSFQDLLNRTNAWIDSGKVVAAGTSGWRCSFTEEDSLIVPEMQFNIEKDWIEFTGQTFSAPDGIHRLVMMKQRTAFVLNKKGVAVESETWAVADSVAVIEDQPQPKRLYFDQPFFIYTIKSGASFPYFAMKVETPEFMVPIESGKVSQ